jgi:hypothetical protein
LKIVEKIPTFQKKDKFYKTIKNEKKEKFFMSIEMIKKQKKSFFFFLFFE